MSELSSAAAAMGRSRSARKVTTARDNVAKARQTLRDPEVQARHKAAQQARRERERLEKAAITARQLVLPETVVEKRGPGRPRTRPLVEADAKRGRGRPKKSAEGAGV